MTSAPKPQLPLTLSDIHQHIRAAGGIIHSDGNIFFTRAEQFIAAAVLCSEPPTADQLWEYGTACAKWQQERDAAICAKQADDLREWCDRNGLMSGWEDRCAAAKACAAAIRLQAGQEGE